MSRTNTMSMCSALTYCGRVAMKITTIQICRWFLKDLCPDSFQKLGVLIALFSYILLPTHGNTDILFICTVSNLAQALAK